jgi:hypothetical protein
MITREKLQLIRKDMDKALEEVAKKHGLKKLAAGNATFLKSSFTIKVEGILEGGESPEEQLYNMYVDIMKLPPLHTKFTEQGREYEIVGMNSRRSPLIKETSNGKMFKTTAQRLQIVEKLKMMKQ